MLHTLTHDERIYALSTLTSLAVAPTVVVVHVQLFLGLDPARTFWRIYLMILGGVAVGCLLLLAGRPPLKLDVRSMPVGLLVGSLCGAGAYLADQGIFKWAARRIQRRRLLLQATARNRPGAAVRHFSDPMTRSSGWTAPVNPCSFLAAGSGAKLIVTFACVGALEEVVYRGGLLALVLGASQPAVQWLGVFAVLSIFALSHVLFGWLHVLAKLPLAGLVTLLAIGFGGIVPPIVAHVVFNVLVATRMTQRGSAA